MKHVEFNHLYKIKLVNFVEQKAFFKIIEYMDVNNLFKKMTAEHRSHFCSYGTRVYKVSETANLNVYYETIYDHMQKEIGMEWMNSTKGTFPKRFANYLYKTYGIKLSSTHLSMIGTLASAANIESQTLYFDIFDSKNEEWWASGNFGDGGSCLWGGRNSALDMFTEHGIMAIRLYNTVSLDRAYKAYSESTKKDVVSIEEWFTQLSSYNKHNSGRGRAWMKYDEGLDAYIIWNGYDAKGEFQALHFARVWATHCGFTYSRIRPLTNNGSDSGKVYINGGTGWILHALDNTKASLIKAYDFQMPEKKLRRHFECEDCGYDSEDESDFITDSEGRMVCTQCMEDQYIQCPVDNQYYHVDNAVYVDDERAIIVDGTKYYGDNHYGNPNFVDRHIRWITTECRYVFAKHTKIMPPDDEHKFNYYAYVKPTKGKNETES